MQCESMIEGTIVNAFARLRILFDGYQDEDICKLAHMCSTGKV